MKILIRIAFLGQNFIGTQKQKKGLTIQSVFEEALTNIYNQPIKVTIGSRLDSQVNALDFALSFSDPNGSITLEHLKYYLRRYLSNDIFIKSVETVADSFSPRYSCINKTYLYLIQNQKQSNPLLNRFTYTPIHPLNEDKLQEALLLFKGEHDFKEFATPESSKEKTILTIDDCHLIDKDGLTILAFTGQSFLRYQVRFMVGACIRHANDKLRLEDIKTLLSGKKLKYQKLKAEPQGLLLYKIDYPSLKPDLFLA
jgi:tRNA pseudouridine38-40 synthase